MSHKCATQANRIQEDGAAPDLQLGGSVVQRLQRFATYGHLKQMVLKMITDEIEGLAAEGANEDRGISLEEMRSLFLQLDSNGQGRVAGLELAQGMHRACCCFDAVFYMQCFICSVSCGGCWCCVPVCTTWSTPTTHHFVAGLRTMGYNVEDCEGEQLLMGLDINHDGSVTFDEFAACLLDWKQVRRHTWV